MLTHDKKLAKDMVEAAKKRLNRMIWTRENADLQHAMQLALGRITLAVDWLNIEALACMVHNTTLPNGARQTALDILQAIGEMDGFEPKDAPYANYFEVGAGTIEYTETGDIQKNYKTIDQRKTLSEAMDLMQECSDYSFVELEYVDDNGERWTVELERKKRG